MQTEQDINEADMEVEYLTKRKAELEGTDTDVVKPGQRRRAGDIGTQ